MEVCLIYPITLTYKPTTFQPLELKRYRFCMDRFHFITCACSLKQIQKNLWALSIVLLAWY